MVLADLISSFPTLTQFYSSI